MEQSAKSPDGGEKRPKRKMKTAFQLELLEKTYAVSTYPSESLRAELSTKLGLSDRQLQMWFCHRRLKDRKANETTATTTTTTTSGLSPHPEPRKAVARMASPALARIEADMKSVKRYYESVHSPLPPAQSMMEMQAISFVESQLGERIRDDGPILGMEFDPLPPGAFGAPIVAETAGLQNQMTRLYEGKLSKAAFVEPFLTSSSSHSGGKRKASAAGSLIVHPQGSGSRALQEYQFLPEQPTARSEAYEKITSSHYYDSPADNALGPYLHGSERVSPSYILQGHSSSAGYMGRHGKHHVYASGLEYDAKIGGDGAFENACLPSDRRGFQEDDGLRLDRKRKGEEARIAKEVEAHEKRIRRELEKQDILRRKREEQIRKEMERHDRERRKEEERLMRERQREEERFQREQRRENERREKFLLKENRRAEKMRRKEELRREKEVARVKAAHERAAARRIAREYMELVEDERLELMELAASKKGLSSIMLLDSEVLQNVYNLRDTLGPFPPMSVLQFFKKPFGVQPWADSEDNIGNLLMVWKFLITFADVLGLWPFTLDEFVQAFHDFDPRLLGEIHMALLKSIIKDIEDVARTPAVSVGANQSSAANPVGGHPHIVEGAYAWGFDIRSWQLHLGPLTWPEILRQFALSAGFGPKLKKRNVDRVLFRDDNEGHDCKDIISTLRNGTAVVNAVALMREKGFSSLRRSRHRLTPGTVKFAAFHVLSLEGSMGLTILEVADKIQKSGLRDLTTSKTPEASIAAALSRDAKLFERTAPSTYCVKPQFRKDPNDAEAILAVAREKIRVFENGLSDSEEAEKDPEEADEASESDGAEDLEVDDEGKVTKEDPSQSQLSNGVTSTPPVDVVRVDQCAEIDESNTGESWVEGLTEGEYSELSVEERLNALVSLISVALEGNSIRIVLEERLEAATALKKQMWAEAQSDKRRMKEEYMTKLQYSSFVGGMRSEVNVDLKGIDVNNEACDHDLVERNQEPSVNNNNNSNNDTTPGQNYGFIAEKSRSQLKSYIGHRAEEMYVYRSLPLGQDRRRNRYWQFVTSASKNDPGSGRIFFESKDGLWKLIDSKEAFDALVASLDTRGIRESYLHSVLMKMEVHFKEALAKNSQSMQDVMTTKEETVEESPRSMICYPGSIDASTSFTIEQGIEDAEKFNTLTRYRDFQKWSWKESMNSSSLCAIKYGKKRGKEVLGFCLVCCEYFLSHEEQCPSCYNLNSTEESGLSLSWMPMRDPVRIQLLKAQLSLIEVSIPPEALQPIWTDDYRKSWGQKLQSSSTPEELLQLLTRLECAVLREYLSPSYETVNELVNGGTTGALFYDHVPLSEPVNVLPWIPATTAAVSMRLMEFDTSISYILQQKIDPHIEQEPEDFLRYAFVKNNAAEIEAAEFPETEGTWPELPSSASGRRRGRGSRGGRISGRGRGRGGRRSNSATIFQEDGERVMTPLGQRQSRRGRGRGRGRGGGRRGRRGGSLGRPRGDAARLTAAEPTLAADLPSSGGDDDEGSSEYEYPEAFVGMAKRELEDDDSEEDEDDDDDDDDEMVGMDVHGDDEDEDDEMVEDDEDEEGVDVDEDHEDEEDAAAASPSSYSSSEYSD